MLNRTTLQGRFVFNPELRFTSAGTPVTSFTLAVDRDFTAKAGEDKPTDFIDCVAWRETGKFIADHFVKGQMAVVDGRLQSRQWKAKDGSNRTALEVDVEHIYFVPDSKADANHHT
jgi:single-strand DNA-binding protein